MSCNRSGGPPSRPEREHCASYSKHGVCVQWEATGRCEFHHPYTETSATGGVVVDGEVTAHRWIDRRVDSRDAPSSSSNPVTPTHSKARQELKLLASNYRSRRSVKRTGCKLPKESTPPPLQPGREVCASWLRRGECVQWAQHRRCPFDHPAATGSSWPLSTSKVLQLRSTTPPRSPNQEVCAGWIKRGSCAQWQEHTRCPFDHPPGSRGTTKRRPQQNTKLPRSASQLSLPSPGSLSSYSPTAGSLSLHSPGNRDWTDQSTGKESKLTLANFLNSESLNSASDLFVVRQRSI